MTSRRPDARFNPEYHDARTLEDVQERHWGARLAGAARGAANRRRVRLGQLPARRAHVRTGMGRDLAYVPAYTPGGSVPRGFQGGSRVREDLHAALGVTPDGYGGFH